MSLGEQSSTCRASTFWYGEPKSGAEWLIREAT